jgi:cbb3-type cytochrome oxidase maturation protein
MEILMLLIPISLVFSIFMIGLFIYSVKSGQFDDLDTPASRMLMKEDTLEETRLNHSDPL